MDNLWAPIDATSWQAVACLSGRVATEHDVASGRAVFFIQGDSEPASLALPVCALQSLDDGSTLQVVIIQAEYTSDGTYLGVRPLLGGNGICSLDEVTLVPDGFGS